MGMIDDFLARIVGSRMRPVTAMVVIPLIACDPVAQGNDVRDSGGWEIASEPVVVLGASEEAPLYRVNSAVRLSDGRIVVAHGGTSSRLDLYSHDGRHLRLIGGNGEGPGEYRFITSLAAGANDSLFVFDQYLQRLTVFSADGQYLRSVSSRVAHTTERGALSAVFRLSESAWVVRGIESVLPGPPNRIVRDTIMIGLVDEALDDFRPLGRVPGVMSINYTLGGRGVVRASVFTPRVLEATWGRCAFVSATEGPSIEVFAADGTHVTTLKGPGRQRPITDGDLGVALAWEEERWPEAERPMRRRAFGELARPDFLPFYYQLILDQWGNIWLQEYQPPYGLAPHWHVLSQAGLHLSDVIMPASIGVFAITEHGVLGGALGEFGEQMVELRPLLGRPARHPNPLDQCVPDGG
jgi:hypothetical protein